MKKYNTFIIEKIELIDPFDEEDWDEIDNNNTTFKIWIGHTTKNIRLMSFPTHIHKIDDIIIIKNDRFKTIYKNNINRFEDEIKDGIIIQNYFIIDNNNYKIEYIEKFVNDYLESRKKRCYSNIQEYVEIIENKYENDEYDEYDDIDVDELEHKILMEKTLSNNIKKYLSNDNVITEIKKRIKESVI